MSTITPNPSASSDDDKARRLARKIVRDLIEIDGLDDLPDGTDVGELYERAIEPHVRDLCLDIEGLAEGLNYEYRSRARWQQRQQNFYAERERVLLAAIDELARVGGYSDEDLEPVWEALTEVKP